MSKFKNKNLVFHSVNFNAVIEPLEERYVHNDVHIRLYYKKVNITLEQM